MTAVAEVHITMLRKMWLIRAFEGKVDESFQRGTIHGTTHLYTGEEAVAVGACSRLETGDLFTSTHRGHGHCIASGADVRRMMAELLGRHTGYCKGKGGSMHIADVSSGNLGANGIVGGGIPLAVGAALSLKMQRTDRVVLCFFGDGAVNQGSFHEAANLAAIWSLPVVFICENNLYGMSFPASKAMKTKSIAERAGSYGMPHRVVEGNDVMAVAQATEGAVRAARDGNGPSFLECQTYRWKGHSKSDANRYRTHEEIEEWKTRCPIARLQQQLLREGILTREDAAEIEREAYAAIDDAMKYALDSPPPPLSELLSDVYA